jgi:hypothetical protein
MKEKIGFCVIGVSFEVHDVAEMAEVVRIVNDML